MAQRPGFTISKLVPVDGGVSPNEYVGKITVEIRVHYPPRQIERVEQVLLDAVAEAALELVKRRAVSPHAAHAVPDAWRSSLSDEQSDDEHP